MKNFGKTIFFLFALVIAAIFIDRYFFDQKMNNIGTATVKRPASYIFSRLENTGFFLRGLMGVGGLVSENENLKRENLSLLSQLADYEDLKNENGFLRRALEISPRFDKKVAYANIFQFQLGLDGYDVLLNKGARDGVAGGDIIITEENVLIGRIEKAYDNFSRALVVNDTDFSVTAKVLNSATAGIARGALGQGLYLDLIVRSDPVKEGDLIVSSGMDLIPPALIVGTVSHVETNDMDLFKKVKIRPATGEVKIGRVLIIKN